MRPRRPTLRQRQVMNGATVVLRPAVVYFFDSSKVRQALITWSSGRFVNEKFPFGSHLARPIVAPSESPMAVPARATGPVEAAGK